MRSEDARVHLKHELARAAGSTLALQRDLQWWIALLREILSCDEQHHHVAREKINVIATSVLPNYLAYMRERIADVRDLSAR